LVLLMLGTTVKIVRHTLFDQTRNEEIVEDLKVLPIEQKLIRYK